MNPWRCCLFAGESEVGGLVVIDGAAQLGAKGVVIERLNDIGILVHDHPDTAQVVMNRIIGFA
jgi:hypothetical protein